MLKIKNRIALLYSLLTIFLIILVATLSYYLLKINVQKQPIMKNLNLNKQILDESYKNNSFENMISEIYDKSKYYVTTDKTAYKNSKPSYKIKTDTEKSDIYVMEDIPNSNGIVILEYPSYSRCYASIAYKFDQKETPKKTSIIGEVKKNGASTVNSESNKLLHNDNLSFPSLYEIINKNNSLSSTLNNQIKNQNTKNNVLAITTSQFEHIFMNNIYNRFNYIILIMIIIIVLINFIFSGRYAKFALKPLMEFTRKVKEQGEFKDIKFIELPKTKDEIYELTNAYNEALGKIKTSYEDLRRLNSYASHELRNSLAVLRAKLEVGEETDKITSYIDRLTGIINDILAMSTPQLSNNNELVDIALICAEAVDNYAGVFNNINLELPEDGVGLIKGKEIWIERCIENLIGNAIKFVDRNKEINEINIYVSEDDKNINVTIYDNGIGIDETKLNRIFTPYYGTNSKVSTGIGLAYIKHVMSLHKGTIFLESKKGEYSKFLLMFPKN
ncbi:HAMP domain-containing histidine kinase [Clostridium sp. P21]|uniref:histidine kinase n=1 Tax=Clostridium muellerianum TaxID=2716538 RepID=A0A7Y0HMY0_9CLOT|nr:HAMP domain-containing sensor histidine kinase [Clostridium muellerianum]NMM63404.1 HAMP domain-containing histidine kinase [Clostridium muellerianum]